MRVFRKFPLLFLSLALAACASGSGAIWQTLQNVWGGGPDVSQTSLNPNFRYLRLVVDGQIVLLALGYADAHPQGPIEVWYSAEKEVLRLQNGRLVGASGTITEWQAVSLPALPTWSAVAKLSVPIRWTRTRDVMPGYRYGVKDALVTHIIAPPGRSQLLGIDPRSLVWFEEKFESGGSTGTTTQISTNVSLPPARYAVALGQGTESVVYAEQCLAPDLCFSWQRWPVPASLGTKK